MTQVLLLFSLFNFEGPKTLTKEIVGANGDEDPPVPIPNTVVKLISVENTWRVTARENRAVLTFLLSSVGRACGC